MISGSRYCGSSPRARGTPPCRTPRVRPGRFIPAGAGNTCSQVPISITAPVHPRGRGEHRHRAPADASAQRFIPAGAGNTARSTIWSRSPPVHPRGRGEHGLAKNFRDCPRGSSPRARGTQADRTSTQELRRFIPAGAGNTFPPALSASREAVHPRGRGEHCWAAAVRSGICGSSPRARGTLAAC